MRCFGPKKTCSQHPSPSAISSRSSSNFKLRAWPSLRHSRQNPGAHAPSPSATPTATSSFSQAEASSYRRATSMSAGKLQRLSLHQSKQSKPDQVPLKREHGANLASSIIDTRSHDPAQTNG